MSTPPVPSQTRIFYLPDSAATEAAGAWLAQHGLAGSLIYLQGDLGAGKTTLVRGFLRALGHQGAVKSPTYTLVETYALDTVPRRLVYHVDLYRLSDAEELEYLGFRDYFDGASWCLVEWPERGAGWLPPADLRLTLDYAESGRRLTVQAVNPSYFPVLQNGSL